MSIHHLEIIGFCYVTLQTKQKRAIFRRKPKVHNVE